MRLSVAACAMIAALAVGAAAAAGAPPSPGPLRGWPIEAPGGTVHRGPDGGVVVVARDGFRFTVTAYRRDATRRWRSARTAGCGNCDEGAQPERLQPDGTYGPIGPEGDDFWAVDGRGRIVPGCSGAVSADGTCIFSGSTVSPPETSDTPFVAARRGDVRLFTVEDPAYTWFDEFQVPPVLVRDLAGLAYTAFARPRERATGTEPTGRLLAVDPGAGAIVWSRNGPREVLAGLRSGVLVIEAPTIQGGTLVALRADGSVMWTRPLPPRPFVSAQSVIYDERRDRVYVGRRGGDRTTGVTALGGATGAQLWRTPTRDRVRLLSVGARGPVYLAVDRPGATSIRAMRLSGAVKWERRTGRIALGAAELANGTVAVSAGTSVFSSAGGLLTVLDPR